MEKERNLFSTQNLIKMALMSVIAVILMEIGKIAMPIFPSFLKIDFSELPAIIGILTIHPLAGIVIVFIKMLLKLTLFGTSSVFVGSVANLIVSLGYILPLTFIVKKHKNSKRIVVGILMGILTMTIAGALANYFIILPMYDVTILSMDKIVEMGHVLNGAIVDKMTFVLYAIAPFNLFKGTLVAVVSLVIVKAMQPVMGRLISRA